MPQNWKPHSVAKKNASFKERLMPKTMTVDVQLTLAEAKAIVRLLDAGFSQIDVDQAPVSNEVTLHRAVEAARSGANKIKAAMGDN